MLRRKVFREGLGAVVGSMLALMISPAHASDPPKPLTDPGRAAGLTAKIGDDRTGGFYFKNGRLVVAVTDRAAAETVQEAGGIPKQVTHSTSELSSIHDELDDLGGIPNTAWGIKASSNQVTVHIFDGVSAPDQDRIEKIAAAHPGAVHIDRQPGELVADTTLRGGMGIRSSQGSVCSAGFNVANSSSEVFTLTAGHCIKGGHNQ